MKLLSRLLGSLGRDAAKEIEQRELELLEANVSLNAIEKLKELLKGKKGLKEALEELLKEGEVRGRVILLVGVNGSGKTTTAAKLAKWFMEKGKRVVVAAADTFRAGSIEQLEELSRRAGFEVVKYHYGADPAAVAYEAVKKDADVVIIDTAGRQETRGDLMEELKKIKRVAKPDLTLMVVDATQGVAAVEQVKKFDEKLGIDGFVVTKLDVDEKGGLILSLAVETGKPIYFVSDGQELDRFRPFSKREYIDNLISTSSS